VRSKRPSDHIFQLVGETVIDKTLVNGAAQHPFPEIVNEQPILFIREKI